MNCNSWVMDAMDIRSLLLTLGSGINDHGCCVRECRPVLRAVHAELCVAVMSPLAYCARQ